MTLEKIRKQLKTVRGFYAERASLERAFLQLPHESADLAKAYGAVMYHAPLDLYKVYFALYVRGLTQEAAAEELNFCPEYIRQKNKKLLLYLQQNLEKEDD